IPPARLAEARAAAAVLGAEVVGRYPLLPGVRPVHEDPVELELNNTWRPVLEVIGAAGLPALEDAGNVLRPRTALKLSLRVPPTLDVAQAARRLKEILEADPPSGARVMYTPAAPSGGWNAPASADWLLASMQRASQAHFGKPPVFQGIGGSIPFMSMLGERFPQAQFLITGVMGPGSNAHGPNEFVDLKMGVRVTACVADVLADHYRRDGAVSA
ncbi:MAG: peptidase M20, partial [Candidatus Rokuibacteriota bacterium]